MPVTVTARVVGEKRWNGRQEHSIGDGSTRNLGKAGAEEVKEEATEAKEGHKGEANKS